MIPPSGWCAASACQETERKLLVEEDLPGIGIAFLGKHGEGRDRLPGRFILRPFLARILNGRGCGIGGELRLDLPDAGIGLEELPKCLFQRIEAVARINVFVGQILEVLRKGSERDLGNIFAVSYWRKTGVGLTEGVSVRMAEIIQSACVNPNSPQSRR